MTFCCHKTRHVDQKLKCTNINLSCFYDQKLLVQIGLRPVYSRSIEELSYNVKAI